MASAGPSVSSSTAPDWAVTDCVFGAQAPARCAGHVAGPRHGRRRLRRTRRTWGRLAASSRTRSPGARSPRRGSAALSSRRPGSRMSEVHHAGEPGGSAGDKAARGACLDAADGSPHGRSSARRCVVHPLKTQAHRLQHGVDLRAHGQPRSVVRWPGGALVPAAALCVPDRQPAPPRSARCLASSAQAMSAYGRSCRGVRSPAAAASSHTNASISGAAQVRPLVRRECVRGPRIRSWTCRAGSRRVPARSRLRDRRPQRRGPRLRPAARCLPSRPSAPVRRKRPLIMRTPSA